MDTNSGLADKLAGFVIVQTAGVRIWEIQGSLNGWSIQIVNDDKIRFEVYRHG